MKQYLSFGGGINSVAMYLMLMDQGIAPGDADKGFEAVFVDHGTDWPETYEYVEMFKSKYPLTVIIPKNNLHKVSYSNLYEYAKAARMVPTTFFRWCTKQFKMIPIMKYYKKPCFNMIGIDYREIKRAKIATSKGVENRWPLIEAKIDRNGCKELIKKHGLPVPPKSGCYICPYQRVEQWKRLRTNHPYLFQKAVELEEINGQRFIEKGKPKKYISNRGIPLKSLVQENQSKLWVQDEYPSCEGML